MQPSPPGSDDAAARAGSDGSAFPNRRTSSASPPASRSPPRARAISPDCATRSARAPAIAKAIEGVEVPLVTALAQALAIDPQWAELLAGAIAAEPAAQVRDGGVIAPGFDAELDELRAIDDHCGEFLVELEARERARTGIANLKVEYNRVHGFYIEVTHAHVQKIPDDYRRRQTLKNAERYVTPELKAFEDRALSAQDRALAREKLLYERAGRRPGACHSGAAEPGRGARRARRADDVRGARGGARFRASRVRRVHRPRRSAAAGIRSSSGRSTPSSRTTSTSRPSAGCWSSPARTWAASRPTCGRRR